MRKLLILNATISPKLLALVFASSFLLGICVQAAAPREDGDEATFTTIDFPDATFTVPLDINPAGEIVGRYVSAADRNTHGFLRSKDGEFTTIGFPDAVFPGATFTSAKGINSRGDIVGEYCEDFMPCASGRGNAHGYLLSEGEFTSIDVPGALDETHAWKINPRGQIVGGYAGADGESHVFLLREGEFTTIDFPVAIALENGGINPRGDIVGFYCDTAPCTSASTDGHGFLLSRGEFTSIDVPDALATVAFGINARGDIVGGYVDTTGKVHGYLLSREERDEDDNETIE